MKATASSFHDLFLSWGGDFLPAVMFCVNPPYNSEIDRPSSGQYMVGEESVREIQCVFRVFLEELLINILSHI